MKSITLDLFSFDELDKTAKEKALTRYRDFNVDFDWWQFEYDDFIELCSYLGIAVEKSSIKFQGFYSQGDGSGFSATVDMTKLLQAIAGEGWKVYAPKQEFPFGLPEVNRRVMNLVAGGILPDEPQISATSRSYGVLVDLGISEAVDYDKHPNVFEELEKIEEWLKQVAETLNRYLYKALECQFEYLTSDTAVEESILINEYLFTADGRSANHLVKLITQ